MGVFSAGKQVLLLRWLCVARIADTKGSGEAPGIGGGICLGAETPSVHPTSTRPFISKAFFIFLF